ncbi:hypothetical protein [Sinorhizobium sp. BJ1]|uniref:hypothetical protein n=1 Tax=Sinorhizobium sp. BJ1 TaxID=2035455 RepID=UPI0011853DCD|nr:hypothetical protein [Sinorhizobium sp. BJ1]
MGNVIFSKEFKRDAVRQVNEEAISFAGVEEAECRTHSRLMSGRVGSPQDNHNKDQAEEIRRLKSELARVTEE